MGVLLLYDRVRVLQDGMLEECKAKDSLHKAAEVMLYDEVTKVSEWENFFDNFTKNT